MPNAMTGASAIMTNGKTAASTTMRVASRRPMATSGDDSSITGSRVHADIDQSDTTCTPAKGDSAAGNSNVAQNAVAARRRSGVAGHAMSAMAARLGRARTTTIMTGTAT